MHEWSVRGKTETIGLAPKQYCFLVGPAMEGVFQISDPIMQRQRMIDAASVHYTHEALALIDVVRRKRREEAVRGGGLADFVSVGGHRCNRSCRMMCQPETETYYVCPQPSEHPERTFSSDGSVLHRWSGEVYVCHQTGNTHVCTMGMCTHQQARDGEIACSLTGRALGVATGYIRETSSSFESGRAMTRCFESASDMEAIDQRMHEWKMSQPGAAQQAECVRAASAASSILTASTLSATLDLSALERAFGSSALRAIGAPLPPAKKRAALPAPRPAPPLPAPVVLAPSDAEQIREVFASAVSRLWDLIEQAYSLDVRMRELADAEKRVIARCVMRTRRGTGGSAASRRVTPDTIAAVHAEETAEALLGLEWVRILAAAPAWKSGAIRAAESQQMVERMWHVWTLIVRSALFASNRQPQLYRTITGALIKIAIDGHELRVCVSNDGGTTAVRRLCAHIGDTAASGSCRHTSRCLTLVGPAVKVRAILAPPGISERAYTPACGHILGSTHQVEAFLSSVFDVWQPASAVRKLCVGT